MPCAATHSRRKSPDILRNRGQATLVEGIEKPGDHPETMGNLPRGGDVPPNIPFTLVRLLGEEDSISEDWKPPHEGDARPLREGGGSVGFRLLGQLLNSLELVVTLDLECGPLLGL
jgi:hypothetical protein